MFAFDFTVFASLSHINISLANLRKIKPLDHQLPIVMYHKIVVFGNPLLMGHLCLELYQWAKKKRPPHPPIEINHSIDNGGRNLYYMIQIYNTNFQQL